MSTSAQVRFLSRPVNALPPAVVAALLGLFWVVFNIVVVWLGVTYQHPVVCPVLVGGVDGAAIAVIAVKKASSRFQAGVTGFLGGLGLNQLDTQTSLISKTAEKIHRLVDGLLSTVTENGRHQEVEDAVLKIIWVAAVVIVAALVAEWVRASKEERSSGPRLRPQLSRLPE
jgi:ABC-type xylose transport system permease subunit